MEFVVPISREDLLRRSGKDGYTVARCLTASELTSRIDGEGNERQRCRYTSTSLQCVVSLAQIVRAFWLRQVQQGSSIASTSSTAYCSQFSVQQRVLVYNSFFARIVTIETCLLFMYSLFSNVDATVREHYLNACLEGELTLGIHS